MCFKQLRVGLMTLKVNISPITSFAIGDDNNLKRKKSQTINQKTK